MEGDTKTLLKISAIVAVSMSYSWLVSKSTRAGLPRLLSLLPVLLLLPFLPLRLASISLRGITAFFFAWLSVFKLLLLSFSLGPLSPSLPLLHFLATSSLPIKTSPVNNSSAFKSNILRFVLLVIVLSSYQYNPPFLVPIYCLHMYLTLELALALIALVVRVGLGLNLAPQFDEPYKSTSLRDFWGRRWNLMVTSILRPSVYQSVSARWGQEAGVMATFLVSGVMHEVVFWYMMGVGPTGEVIWFFVVNGFGMLVEGIGRRKGWGKGVRREVKTVVTCGFVAGTGYWLFFPPVTRNGTYRVVVEEAAGFLGMVGRTGVGWLLGRKL